MAENPAMGAYGGDPLNNPVDEVRFLAGDRSQDDPLFTAGEIKYCLAKRSGDPLLAAEYALVCLRSYMMQFPDESVGPESQSNSQVYENLGKQLLEIRRQIAIDGGFMYVGGVAIREDAKDRRITKRPDFTKTMLEPVWDRAPAPELEYGRFGLPGWIDPWIGD